MVKRMGDKVQVRTGTRIMAEESDAERGQHVVHMADADVMS